MPQVPEKIGKYEIAEQIGVGGFGAVFRGRDPFIKRQVAVKTCQVNDEEIKNRFFREAELAGNLHHRNITTIFDFGVENGIPYIVQEFLTGEDLDKKIKRGDFVPIHRKVEVVMAIAEGLEYAHNASIIHRDIKPSNIRLLENGAVKIMDFGIAKSLETASNLTQTGITLGTSAYLAPEQIRGEPVDRRTDIFALGILSYELLTYRKPFRGEHLSTVLYKILNETAEPIAKLAPEVPAALSAAVDRAMAKERENRYPSMEEFRRDLAEVYREITGSSARLPAGTAALPVDPDATLRTPSKGMEAMHITPPSGALARVPVPAEATPTTPVTLPRPGAGLELVNFRNPAEAIGEQTHAAPAPRFEVPARRFRVGFVAGAIVAAAAVAAVLWSVNRRPVPSAQRPAVTAVPLSAPAELPKPEIGVDAAPGALPTHAPAAADAPPAAPPAESPAGSATAAPEPQKLPARFPVQLSSIPSATIYVDDRKIGPSVPAKTIELAEGAHEVRFEGDGLAHRERLTVGPGGPNRLHHTFSIGYLVIQAGPSWQGASVIVDGKYKATLSGAPVKLPAGTYSVTLHRAEFQPVTTRITIPKGRETVWTPAPAVSVESEN